MLTMIEIQAIMSRFGRPVQSITGFYDTSRSDHDKRYHYLLDGRYVLKVHAASVIWEARLQEIRRLIGRYRAIGVYCPDLIPTTEGALSCAWQKDGQDYTCYVEEYAIYPAFDMETEYDRKEVIEHIGVLASRYTGVDLSEIKSMWSIIDLSPLDVDVDEKQENANTLINALRQCRYGDLANQVDCLNATLRKKIMTVFDALPRCVYQGDLNSTNVLHRDGHFAGLIDFNMAGTDVNINVFLNETNWFPDDAAIDAMTVPAILVRQDAAQNEALSVILRHYALNDDEKYAFPYYKRIVDLFQYPNVCSMVAWLHHDARREPCAAFIRALVEKPLL